ncbi:ice-binding family protein [Planktosalinus lacus]|uniref:DUF3494 domain-containing protein n=1 Tax=Planktosalinus lacus TaxID=1526573 RepID=A0A8J2Y932_9FLAO|nr:ice-binding family protein [Planktosalinus lacus]GGD90178.1 hypothetical protein GCM10011312_12610 [Planktosalinus lacus]
MKITIKPFLILLLVLSSTGHYSQVGIGTITPDASSILDVSSNSKGLLMPRLSTAQRDAILLPASGLMIYNLTLNDGQINVGTPSVPNWIGIKGQDGPMIDSVTEGESVSTTSTSYLLVPGMTISPPSGTYLVLFNAQLSSSQTFSSDQGVIDAANLYDELMAYPGGVSHALTFGSGEVLSPGVYDVNGAPSIAGILTMDGGGDPNSVFIIRGSGAFTTGVGTTIVLTGGAKPENIFWVSNEAMSTAANTIMKGTMLGGGTGAGAVSFGADSDLEGRLFTKLGAVSLGANVVLTASTGIAPVSLGVLSTFAMWSSSGAVSDVASATTTGDVGTALGDLTMTGTHTGEEYPAGTTSSTSRTTYSMYQNGVEVVNSSRTIHLPNAIVSLQAVVTITAGESIEVRWKVDAGEATLNHRTLSLVHSGY